MSKTLTEPSRRSLSRPTTVALALALLGVGAAGCDAEPKADAANEPAEKVAGEQDAAKGADKAADAGPIVGKPVEGVGGIAAVKEQAPDVAPYELTVQKSGDYAEGKEAVVMLALVPKEDWHLNLEYPTKVQLKGSEGVKLAKEELRQEDASSFSEKGFEFGVNFTPTSSGEQQVTGKIKFAVCQDEACSPRSEEIAFALAVN